MCRKYHAVCSKKNMLYTCIQYIVECLCGYVIWWLECVWHVLLNLWHVCVCACVRVCMHACMHVHAWVCMSMLVSVYFEPLCCYSTEQLFPSFFIRPHETNSAFFFGDGASEPCSVVTPFTRLVQSESLSEYPVQYVRVWITSTVRTCLWISSTVYVRISVNNQYSTCIPYSRTFLF